MLYPEGVFLAPNHLPVPTFLVDEAVESFLTPRKLSRAPVWPLELCRVQCGLPPLATIIRPLVSSLPPGPGDCQHPVSDGNDTRARHLEPTEVLSISVLAQHISWD